MKLLIITAVSTFEKPIKSALKKAHVNAFSYTRVTGYKNISDQPQNENWFSSNIGEHESILFYVFLQDELVDRVNENINALNKQEESNSKIHVAVVDILKHNEF
ncbi:MAG: hypothetical protein MI975_02180 [Cytophagales bacterium]|nr:hypothetical protein [Cytophagales bacterium]